MRPLPAALAAAALAATLFASTASARVHITLRYLTKQTSFRVHDTAPKGRENAGDAFDFTEHLLVPRGVAGSDRVHCTLTSRTSTLCSGRLFFREGSISVRGRVDFGRPSLIAVTGGTGLFRGQRGTLEIRDAPHNSSRLTLRLR